jgi:two-component system nitrate/nitrite response regulator NarL
MPVAAIRVLVVEDDPAFEDLLSRAAHRLADTVDLVACETAFSALAVIEKSIKSFDLALIDLGLPDLSGVEVIRRIRDRFEDLPILVVSVLSAERSVLSAIRAGACGYILKDDSEAAMSQAMREALNGNYPISPALARYLFKLAGGRDKPADLSGLTRKELELLQWLARGKSYNEAARSMGVTLATVQTHIRNLYRKLDVHSQVQAVTKAQHQGLV